VARAAGEYIGMSRQTASSQNGFTLIEVLVVTSIISTLAAIALPSFTSQRAKAQDSEAIIAVRTAQTAVEALRIQSGTFSVTPDDLKGAEKALNEALDLEASGDASSYVVSVASDSAENGGGRFTVTRSSSGISSRTCDNPGKGRCSANGDW
jgi:prepilin-type N-terminal cleavage/methylation domain-containing protein